MFAESATRVPRGRSGRAGAAAQRIVEVVVEIDDRGGVTHRFDNRRDTLGVDDPAFPGVIGRGDEQNVAAEFPGELFQIGDAASDIVGGRKRR